MIARYLRLIALLLVLVALTAWAATGAHRGWTKTSVPVRRTDEITGLTVDDYRKRFVPGVDFLGVAGFAAAVLFAASFLARKSAPAPLANQGQVK